MKMHTAHDMLGGRQRKTFFAIVSILVAIALTAMPVYAYDWGGVTVHITGIQTSFMPGGFDFVTDNTPSTCNGVIFYFGQGSDAPTQQANAKAVLASLLSQELSGHSVTLYGINPTSTFQYCVAQAVWINNQ